MAATAAYAAKVQTSTDNATWLDAEFANDASHERMMEILETTNFKNAAATPERERIYGIGDASFTLQFAYDDSGANQKMIRTAQNGRSALYIKYLPDGTHGMSMQVLVESTSHKTSVGGLATFECSLKKTGAYTVI